MTEILKGESPRMKTQEIKNPTLKVYTKAN
jgi:hypothetical protein